MLQLRNQLYVHHCCIRIGSNIVNSCLDDMKLASQTITACMYVSYNNYIRHMQSCNIRYQEHMMFDHDVYKSHGLTVSQFKY